LSEARLRVASVVAAPREVLWKHATSFAGVNEELWPLHMIGPKDVPVDASVPMGTTVLRSVVTLFRVLPIDLHSLGFESIDPGRGFHERSRSLLQRSWIHVRTLEDEAGGTRVTDEVTFRPRLPRALVAPIVARAFRGRHRVLRAKFGEAAGCPALDVVLE
jgi:ligand-binding SRPBCC domain-containing protein